MDIPRGIRNNNPGNIDKSQTHWKGEVFPGSDERFCTFSSMAFGVRAICVIAKNYTSEGIDTIQDMVNRWAPPSENDTNAYVKAVCADMNLPPVAMFFPSRSNYFAWSKAIIRHENGLNDGQPWVSDADINAGVNAALFVTA